MVANKQSQYQEYLSNLNQFEKKYAPEELFWKGDFNLLKSGRRVSVVGSRNASTAGLARAKALVKKLVEYNITVVSGLAAGIDTVAHETAISEGGKTIAVVGTPLDTVYPAKNKKLFEQIANNHLAISQFKEGSRVFQGNFPIRNRTMALISDATIIVEASQISGTKHQGWEALRLGRKLYIMENILQTAGIKWPFEMQNYGAEILTRENLDLILEWLPSYTEEITFDF
jgi:DNA processing protein